MVAPLQLDTSFYNENGRQRVGFWIACAKRALETSLQRFTGSAQVHACARWIQEVNQERCNRVCQYGERWRSPAFVPAPSKANVLV